MKPAALLLSSPVASHSSAVLILLGILHPNFYREFGNLPAGQAGSTQHLQLLHSPFTIHHSP